MTAREIASLRAERDMLRAACRMVAIAAEELGTLVAVPDPLDTGRRAVVAVLLALAAGDCGCVVGAGAPLVDTGGMGEG